MSRLGALASVVEPAGSDTVLERGGATVGGGDVVVGFETGVAAANPLAVGHVVDLDAAIETASFAGFEDGGPFFGREMASAAANEDAAAGEEAAAAGLAELDLDDPQADPDKGEQSGTHQSDTFTLSL